MIENGVILAYLLRQVWFCTVFKFTEMVVEHHFMRDLKYKERIAKVYECTAEKGVKVITAAEYLGREIEMLEARRKEIYTSNQNR